MLKNSNPSICLFITILLLLALSACTTVSGGKHPVMETVEESLPPQDADPSPQQLPPAANENPQTSEEELIAHFKEMELGESELSELLADPPESLEVGPPPEKLPYIQSSIPITMNNQVWKFIRVFQTSRRKNIQNALFRMGQYIDDYKRIFREYGVPEDLCYLPIIESGYRTCATSRASAQGIWQFMASTGRMYGLQINWVLDERNDPYKSAAAAARYLKRLYEIYDDWHLCLAVYNGGSRRLGKAMRLLKTRDFFILAESKHLRKETRNYVPAFLASLIIAKSPEQFGFTLEPRELLFDAVKSVITPSPVSIREMAEKLGVSMELLKLINPELCQDVTPFDRTHYTIRIPQSADETQLDQLKRQPPEKEKFAGYYKVKQGDSLYSIARKFKTTVAVIKRANKLRSNLLRPGKRLIIPRG